MAQIYRIYINEASLIVSEFIPEFLSNVQRIDIQRPDFNSFYYSVVSKKAEDDYLILTKNAKRLFKELKKNVSIIKAAGGLVENEHNNFLFIFRKGKWDLPKGKIDLNEKTKKAAVREVEEECGIKVNKVTDKICRTWHAYEQAGKVILKKTTWYKMKAVKQPKLVPQLEEDITEARWLPKAEFAIVKQNTYPLILDVMRSVEH